MLLRRLFLFVPAMTVLLYACGDDDVDEPASAAGDVILEGDVTDETFVAFESAVEQSPPANDPARAAVLDEPAEGAMLPRTPAPLFRWHFGPTAERPGGATLRRAALEPASPAGAGFLLPGRALPAAHGSFAWLAAPFREVLGPIRSAHAHGDPFNGTATYLRFSVDADPKLVEVFTGATSYTPAADAWEKMTGAGAPITLTMVSATFEQDRVVQDGGPVAGSVITFTVAP
jgi:hypothetical protein